MSTTSTTAKLILGATMTLALAFGFAPLFIQDFPYDFDKLHIFLFNLVSGATILLGRAQADIEHNRRLRSASNSHQETEAVDEGRSRSQIGIHLTSLVWTYYGIALLYALSAFFEVYPITIALSVPLILIVERVRIRRFALLPLDIFKNVPTAEKFLQAALLCLSIGLGIASVVILNNQYTHWFFHEKLTIDVFFLGYSFPLSLLAFSVMYGFMDEQGSTWYAVRKELSFWTITVGVNIFFLFIIYESAIGEIVISNVLMLAVLMTYHLFMTHSQPHQQRSIMASGMGFLVVTAITGVWYLFAYIFPDLEPYNDAVLMLHATAALYGWNLSGLFCIVRDRDMPISVRGSTLIGFHWVTVMVLAPLGKYFAPVAPIAVTAYVALLLLAFFARTAKTGTSS